MSIPVGVGSGGGEVSPSTTSATPQISDLDMDIGMVVVKEELSDMSGEEGESGVEGEFGVGGGGRDAPSTSNVMKKRVRKSSVRRGRGRRWNVKRRKMSSGSGRVGAPSAPNPDQEYVVETILEKKQSETGAYLYYVKWLGYEACTWEPLANLDGCEEILEEFEEKLAQEEQSTQRQGQGESQQEEEEEEEEEETPPPLLLPQSLPFNQLKKSHVPKSEGSVSGGSYFGRRAGIPAALGAAPPSPPPPPQPQPQPTLPSTSMTTTSSPDIESEEEMSEYEVMEKCPSDVVPKELMGVVKIDGLLTYLIEWDQEKENQVQGHGLLDMEPDRRLIRADVFRLHYPGMVIQYYEKHINFIGEGDVRGVRESEEGTENNRRRVAPPLPPPPLHGGRPPGPRN